MLHNPGLEPLDKRRKNQSPVDDTQNDTWSCYLKVDNYLQFAKETRTRNGQRSNSRPLIAKKMF